MTVLRQLMILAMVPLTLWSGTPQIACRCSTGEIRLFCSKLNQAQFADASGSCCASKAAGGHICCGTAKAAKCSACPSETSRESGSTCCSSGCTCSRIVLSSELILVPTKAQAPDLVLCDWAVVSAFLPIQIPRMTRVDLSRIGSVPRVPDDIIVLCERWLI